MNVTARYTDANGNGILTINGEEWSGPIPPNSGDLRAIYDAWIAEKNEPIPHAPEEPSPPRSIAMWRARTIMKVTPWGEGTLFQAVQAAIASLTDPLQKASAEEALERGTDFDRDGVFVPMLAAVVGISDEQMDQLMEQAVALPA